MYMIRFNKTIKESYDGFDMEANYEEGMENMEVILTYEGNTINITDPSVVSHLFEFMDALNTNNVI
jgi:response regulator RpfG family c-di-GMP phosphodiesterase